LPDSLPAHIRDTFGSIRPQSLPAAKALQKYGFTACDKYDLLDGGQYMETSIASLRATAQTKTFYVEKASGSDPGDDRRPAVFSPKRAMPQFVAAWGNANADGQRLLIDPALFQTLNLDAGEPAEVLL
jgi:arginine/ornithine N-succinyltransferase beta subunit